MTDPKEALRERMNAAGDCTNCGSVRCMHFVLRDWHEGSGIDECDGWCCPECRPDDLDNVPSCLFHGRGQAGDKCTCSEDDFADAREGAEHYCPECGQLCPAFGDGVRAENARITSALVDIADAYLPMDGPRDVWEFTGWIAQRFRDGNYSVPKEGDYLRDCLGGAVTGREGELAP